jgi:hypothetical protein
VTNNDPTIDEFDFDSAAAVQFVALCRVLYERGFDHGRHDALSEARLACEDAGQTAAAAVVGRLA